MNRREICLAAAATAIPALLSSQNRGARAAEPGSTAAVSDLSLAEASLAIHNGKASCRDLAEACLQNVAELNPQINAIITPMREEAFARAAVLDAEARAGKFRSPLHGIPLVLKDAIDTAGTRTTAASAQYENRVPTEDAHVVQRLRQAGALIIAKANLAEFSVSPSGASSHFGPVHNPWAPDRVTGGSSSGSAAAISTRMCFGALGTDSGGSVRIPAAWCGIVGLKPTDGLVSRTGIIPSVALLDSCGPMARRVEDVAMLFTQMVGYDAQDVRSLQRPAEDYAASARKPISHLRVAVVRKPFFEGLDPETAKCVEDSLAVMGKLTHGVKEVTLSDFVPPLDPLINTAEICSYHRELLKQPSKYTPTTRKILKWCEDYVEDPKLGSPAAKLSRYIESREALERRRRTIDAAFEGFDVLVMPTLKVPPPTIHAALHAESSTADDALFSIENTMIFNILGLPALTVPCGFSASGLPVGVMICGPRFSEGTLLALGAAYQNSTQWHLRSPDMAALHRKT
jgi:aspartyl-tRNA(Asn)/glutamyl-tRNA(Gln) amidotransferase subunit A